MVIGYKEYQQDQVDNIPWEVVQFSYDIFTKENSFDLAKMLRNQ